MALAGGKPLKITRVGKYRTAVPGEARRPLEVNEGDGIAWLLGEGRVVAGKHVEGGNRER